jgi:hypothetical protein
MTHHAPWHIARFPENQDMRGPDTQLPDLKGLDEVGSGEQFLRFHRVMIRIFKWVLENTPEPKYEYKPWKEFPSWLTNDFEAARPGYLSSVYAEVERLSNEGSADDLGNCIESTLIDRRPVANIHNLAHGTIHGYETRNFGPNNQRLRDAGMNSFSTAPHNEHFWGLHGWIDERFAHWQLINGEIVDQSPLPPEHSGHERMFRLEFKVLPSVAPELERQVFRTVWD